MIEGVSRDITYNMMHQTLIARLDHKYDEDLPAFVVAVIGGPSVGDASLPVDVSAISDRERSAGKLLRHQTKLS